MTYAMRCALALDIFANAVTGGNFDETISSRVERVSLAHHGWAKIWRQPGILIAKLLLGGLDWLQRGHGALAVSSDSMRAEAIVQLEKTVIGKT